MYGTFRQALLKPELVPLLEDLLDSSSSSLRELQNLKERNMLDLGRKVSSRNIEAILSEVKKDVDSFLDVKDISKPSLASYSFFPQHASLFWPYLFDAGCLASLSLALLHPGSSFQHLLVGLNAMLLASGAAITALLQSHAIASHNLYWIDLKEIQLRRVQRINFTNILVHEYTHHVLHAGGIPLSLFSNLSALGEDAYLESRILTEGHARGVSRWLAAMYREREDNPAFLYLPLNYTVGELKSVYIWMCHHLGLQGYSSLFSTRTEVDKVESDSWHESGMPTPHAFGSAVFLLFEAEYGSGLYKSIVNNRFIIK